MLNSITVADGRIRIEDFISEARSIGYKDSTVKEMTRVIRKLLSSMSASSILSPENVQKCICDLGIDKLSHSRYVFFTGSCSKFLNYLYQDNMNFKPAKPEEPVLEEIIEGSKLYDFIQENASSNSQNTRNRKILAITRFLNALSADGIGSWDELSFDIVNRHFIPLTIEDKYIVSAYIHYHFLNGTLKKDYSAQLRIEKRPLKLPSIYSESEIVELISQIDLCSKTGTRNKAILLLAARYGLRSGDIVNLKMENFDFNKGYLTFLQQKTGIKVSTVIDSELIACLKDYISEKRPTSESGFIFLNENAPFNHMSTGIIRYMMRKYLATSQINTGNRRKGPHSLRSSMASAMVENNIPYEVVERKLGHQSSDSILRYVKVSAEKLRQCALSTIEESGNFSRWLNENAL